MVVKLLFIMGLLCPSICVAQHQNADATKHAEPAPIFRYVDTGTLGPFWLGEPFGRHAMLTTPEEPHSYRLRPRTFGGAESIVVRTDSAGIVRQIRFEYGPKYEWTSMVASYVESLGPPYSGHGTDAVVWNDGKTEFTLARAVEADYASHAVMLDLEQ